MDKKILQNVKTMWISILSPLKHVISEYHTVLVNMYFNHFIKPTILTIKVNYELMVALLENASKLRQNQNTSLDLIKNRFNVEKPNSLHRTGKFFLGTNKFIVVYCVWPFEYSGFGYIVILCYIMFDYQKSNCIAKPKNYM